MKKNELKNNNVPAIYVRVSTKDQEEGYGLDYQLEDCKEALERDKLVFDEKHVYSDTASGANDKRPGWQKFMDAARRGEISHVYFWKLDRMMRSEYYYFVNAKELEDLGVELRFATQDLKDPFHLAIQVAVTAEEKRRILERTRSGRERAIAAGKWAWGLPTYGYILPEGKTWPVVCEEQAKWVQKMFEWLVYERCSLKEITRRLNDNSVPTWSQSIKAQRKESKRKVSEVWWPRTVGRILVNEIYIGKTHFNKYKKGEIDHTIVGNQEYMRDKDEWIEIKLPPIITNQLYKRALKQLRANSEFAKRKKKRSYAFSGLLYCNKCGFKLRAGYAKPTSETAKGSRNYYSYTLKKNEAGSKKCKYCGTVAESRLMPIWEVLKSVLMNPDNVYEKLKKYSKDDKTERVREKIKLIDKEVISLAEDERRANFAFLDNRTISEEEYKKRMFGIKRRKKELESEKDKSASFVVSEEEKANRINIIGEMHKKIKKNLENATYETKDVLLHLLVNRIDLNLGANIAEVEFHFLNNVLKDSSYRSSCFNYGRTHSYCAGYRKNLCHSPRTHVCGSGDAPYQPVLTRLRPRVPTFVSCYAWSRLSRTTYRK